MTSEQTFKYEPETISAPGETLKRTIDSIGLKQSELARRLGLSEKHVSQIINGKAPISPKTAVALERVVDVPASFWNERQRRYEEAKAEQKDRERLKDQVSWLDNFPTDAMVELGFVKRVQDRVEQLRRLLDFFGVAGPAEWRDEWQHLSVGFRQHDAFESSKFDTAAWLRAGERASRQMACRGYDGKAFREVLETVRSATRKPVAEFCEIARREFCRAGVALVFVPELPESRVYGATRWLAPDRALIQLSFRYKRDDIFIFTLFHEAAHVLKHRKKDIFLEDERDEEGAEAEDEESNALEKEADQFARDFLIPPDAYRNFLRHRDLNFLSYDDIEAFATQIDVAPSVVAGRLHHEERVPPTHFRKLYRRVDEAVVTTTV